MPNPHVASGLHSPFPSAFTTGSGLFHSMAPEAINYRHRRLDLTDKIGRLAIEAGLSDDDALGPVLGAIVERLERAEARIAALEGKDAA